MFHQLYESGSRKSRTQERSLSCHNFVDHDGKTDENHDTVKIYFGECYNRAKEEFKSAVCVILVSYAIFNMNFQTFKTFSGSFPYLTFPNDLSRSNTGTTIRY